MSGGVNDRQYRNSFGDVPARAWDANSKTIAATSAIRHTPMYLRRTCRINSKVSADWTRVRRPMSRLLMGPLLQKFLVRIDVGERTEQQDHADGNECHDTHNNLHFPQVVKEDFADYNGDETEAGVTK